jgi:hypothetical protein
VPTSPTPGLVRWWRQLGYAVAAILLLALIVCAPLAVYFGWENHQLLVQHTDTQVSITHADADLVVFARWIVQIDESQCLATHAACPPPPHLPYPISPSLT